jgi:type IV secretion system protein VirB6
MNPSGIGDFVYFKLIYDYLNTQIEKNGLDLMQRMMTWASMVALVMVTLWIMIQGYRMVTGQSREPMMHVVSNMARIVLIVAAATGMSIAGTDLHQFLTTDMSTEITYLFTGDSNQTAASLIDQNLAYTQLAMSAIDAVQTVQTDDDTRAEKARAIMFAGFGSASPPMAAGAMLLLYQFTIAIFIGMGPLFILCLIFDQTKELFRRWLLYGIGTLFSMAVLAMVTTITLGLTIKVGEAIWAAKLTNSLLQIDSEGLSNQAMQQGGIGLLLTVLIISVPPLAAMFFQGTVGNFMHFSAFGAGGSPGPQGQPAGSYGSPAHSTQGNAGQQAGGAGAFGGNSSASRVAGASSPAQTDTVKKLNA